MTDQMPEPVVADIESLPMNTPITDQIEDGAAQAASHVAEGTP